MEILPEALQVLEPVVTLEGSLLPRATSPLHVVITNPNEFPIRRVELLVSGALEPHRVEHIDGTHPDTGTMIALPAVSSGAKQNMRWVLSFYVGGAKHQVAGESGVNVSRLLIEDEKDIFDL